MPRWPPCASDPCRCAVTEHCLQDGVDLGLGAHVEPPVGLIENDVQNLQKRINLFSFAIWQIISTCDRLSWFEPAGRPTRKCCNFGRSANLELP